jgi:hypothetical protein
VTAPRTSSTPTVVLHTADALPGAPRPDVRHLQLKRAVMAGLTAFVTVNIWTGCPLFALWVGSQAVGHRELSMGAVGLVVIVLAVTVFVFALALTWLNNVYDELVGRPRAERRARWLRSMRAEDEGYVSQRVGSTLLERIVMVNVYLCVTAFAAWYLFFAGAPSPSL